MSDSVIPSAIATTCRFGQTNTSKDSTNSEILYKRAIARRDEYTSKIREAMKLSSDRESRKKILRAAVEWAKGLGEKLREKSEKTAQTCSANLWQASHNGDHGTASVVFNMHKVKTLLG